MLTWLSPFMSPGLGGGGGGGGVIVLTVTVALPLVLPPAPVQLSVYVEVDVGDTANVPLVACDPVHAPLAVQDVVFVDDHVNVLLDPLLTVAGLAEKFTVGAVAGRPKAYKEVPLLTVNNVPFTTIGDAQCIKILMPIELLLNKVVPVAASTARILFPVK
jgi:hypothetical protein